MRPLLLVATEPRFTGRVWPTGKFGVSRVRETPFLSEFKSHPETDETQFRNNAIAVHGLMAVAEYEGKADILRNPDLSNVSNSRMPKKRGQKGITRHGRNLISSAAVVAEKKYGRHLLSFGTVTLPDSSVEGLRAVSRDWSGVVKRFAESLKRGLQSKGLPAFSFGVTEVQPKRLARTGLPALHLHFVFVGRNSRRSAWKVTCKDIRRWWVAAIARYFPADTDFSSTENVKGIRVSAAAYLGKYMSKGVADIATLVEAGFEEWIPSAWYSISHEFRRHVLSQVVSGERVGDWLNWLCHVGGNQYARWIQPILIKNSSGREVAVGFSGTLNQAGQDTVALIANWNKEASSN